MDPFLGEGTNKYTNIVLSPGKPENLLPKSRSNRQRTSGTLKEVSQLVCTTFIL